MCFWSWPCYLLLHCKKLKRFEKQRRCVWPVTVSFRVLRWTSRPPNWNQVQVSSSASCWTDWPRRLWRGGGFPSEGTDTFHLQSPCFLLSLFYFLLSFYSRRCIDLFTSSWPFLTSDWWKKLYEALGAVANKK